MPPAEAELAKEANWLALPLALPWASTGAS